MFIENENKPVILYEDFFDKKRTKNLLKYLKEKLIWKQDIYKFGGKEVKSPRLTSFLGETKYTYSGQTKKSIPFTKSIQYLANEIEKYLNIESGHFNGCLLNHYRDGNDSISYHTDNEKDMIEDGIIAVLSIGSERKFYIKNNKTKKVIKYSLPNCSLTIMNPICQKDWKHSIPKEKKIEEERISLTFRKFNK